VLDEKSACIAIDNNCKTNATGLRFGQVCSPTWPIERSLLAPEDLPAYVIVPPVLVELTGAERTHLREIPKRWKRQANTS
jgi:hypothetical protein